MPIAMVSGRLPGAQGSLTSASGSRVSGGEVPAKQISPEKKTNFLIWVLWVGASALPHPLQRSQRGRVAEG